MADADAHVRLASKGTSDDPAGALQLSYDAARKAAAALLAVQGLRATTRGGHIAVIDSVRAQSLESIRRSALARRSPSQGVCSDLGSCWWRG